MKTLFTRRPTRITLLLGLALVLAMISWLLISRSPSAGQGKGGDVVGTPPPKETRSNPAPLENYKFLFSFRHDDIVTCASFSQDGRWLATGSEAGTIIVLDLATQKQRVIEGLHPNGNGVNVVSFSKDGQFLLTGGWGARDDQKTGLIKILRTSDYSVLETLDAHRGHSIDFLRISNDNNWLISADDATINVWDFKDKRVRWHFPRLDSGLAFDGERTLVLGIGDVKVAPVDSNVPGFAGQTLASGSLAFVDIVEGKIARVVRTGSLELIRRIAFTKANPELLALAQSASGYSLQVIDGRTYRIIRSIPIKPYQPDPGWRLIGVPRIDFEVAENYPVVAYNDRRVTKFIDYESGKVVDFDHRSMVGFTFDHTGERFAVLGGIKNEALTGVAEQHYWTVNVFSFKPF